MKHKFEEILANRRIKDILAATKLNELIHVKEDPVEKKKHTLIIVLAAAGAIAAAALIAYLVYRFTAPDYLEDLDEDFDDFEEDFGLDSEAEKSPDNAETK